jgi:basic membrane lipoprotein Med (substrate-binding protein (PBP1-ABC) superfamily)
VEWTYSWYNPEAEEAAAQALIDEGCDIIVSHTDSCVTGDVADENGVYYMSLNGDCSMEAPLSFLVAAYYDWVTMIRDVVEAVHDGIWEQHPGRDWWYNLEQGGVRLSQLSFLAPDDLKTRIDEIDNEIESGRLEVFPNMSDSQIRNMNYLEANVVGQIPQQPVEDGE